MEKRPSSPLAPGDVVGDKYRIERLLGEGGMGLVFVAHQERLNRRVAIKCLRPRIAKRADALARFEREARAVASLESDHVAKMIDVGHLDDGAPYLVMELLEGEDLAALLARSGPLPVARAVSILLDVCDAVGEAHGLGIVHRDLKPGNIFLHRRANATIVTKVLDFGISKVARAPDQAELTATAAFMGSPRYMSPEQLRDVRSVTARTDIWALGVTLYELLAGSPPFAAGSFARMCTLVMTSDPPSLLGERDDVPETLDDIVMRCLMKDPNARFATAEDLAAALRAVPLSVDAPATSFLSRSVLPAPAQSTMGASTAGLVTAPPTLDADRLTPTDELDTAQAPPAGTLLGLDLPKELSARSDVVRLRLGAAVGAVFLAGGAAWGASALFPTEPSRSPASVSGSQVPAPAHPSARAVVDSRDLPVASSRPEPSALDAAVVDAVVVEAAVMPPPSGSTPRRARPAVARPSDPFDLPLAR